LGIKWPSERSLAKVTVNRVFEVVVGGPGYSDQFPYIDCWQDAVLGWSMWLNLHLEEVCRVVVARVAAAFKCRKLCKKPEIPH
jgi:adenine-specific DNA methylase